MSDGLFNTAIGAGLGAAAGYGAYRFIKPKAVAEATKYVKEPKLIETSIAQTLGDEFKNLSKTEIDEYVAEGVKQNKSFLKKARNIYIAAGAIGLMLLSNLFPKHKDKGNI